MEISKVLPCAAAFAAFLATLLLASAAAFWLGAQPAAEALLRSLLAPSAAPSAPIGADDGAPSARINAEDEPVNDEYIDGEPINGKSSQGESIGDGATRGTEAAATSAFGSDSFLLEDNASVPRILEFDLIKTYPHDRRAFTQGLLYVDHDTSGGRGSGEGVFYESTGEYGRSTVREVDVATGEVLNNVPQSADVFGEGLALHNNRLYQLAWRVRKGLVYDRETLQPRGSFQHDMADGWGLSVLNGSVMVGTDGSSTLFHLDSSSFKAKGRVTVKDGKRSIPNLNELEVVGGLVWANVWLKVPPAPLLFFTPTPSPALHSSRGARDSEGRKEEHPEPERAGGGGGAGVGQRVALQLPRRHPPQHRESVGVDGPLLPAVSGSCAVAAPWPPCSEWLHLGPPAVSWLSLGCQHSAPLSSCSSPPASPPSTLTPAECSHGWTSLPCSELLVWLVLSS
ncbi:unnamed protein product [Closterium sp. Naga37s-1]|nr:unnamed protein product [Closterium sp. Naga37s-1]